MSGHIDDRSPATITGTVGLDQMMPGLAGVFGNGVGNVTVLLDGRTAQQTDLRGNFQFQFVQPGDHQLSIDPASLPRGVSADMPYQAVQVRGGQIAQVAFHLGAFSALEGVVTRQTTDGGELGVPNLGVIINKTITTHFSGRRGNSVSAGCSRVSIPSARPAFAAGRLCTGLAVVHRHS